MSTQTLSTRTIEGWLIKYGLPSYPIDLPSGATVQEVILQDAFAKSVDAINAGEVDPIECNIEHIPDDALARLGETGVNVAIENRPEGVYATITLAADSVSDDIFDRISAGFVKGLSVEFDTPEGVEPSYEVIDGTYIRQLSQLVLRGFAITAAPFYPDAQIVKATDGNTVTMQRSIQAAEVNTLAVEVARVAREREWDMAERQAFLLGIGR
jgi:HK97 family phage prohead protease